MFLQAFHSQLRVQHVGGAVIPPFRALLVTKSHKFIRLNIKNPLIFIRIQSDKHAHNYVAISSSLSPRRWHRFYVFCISLENRS